MDYVIVRAKGSDATYIITADYKDAVRTYQRWLAAYVNKTGDKYARAHLIHLRQNADALRGQPIEYRSCRYGDDASTDQIFVLGVLAWPKIWRLPPEHMGRDWGRPVRRLADTNGTFELRTDGQEWRILWLDGRSEAAFTTSRSYARAAEAAAVFAFIDAALEGLPRTCHADRRQRR